MVSVVFTYRNTTCAAAEVLTGRLHSCYKLPSRRASGCLGSCWSCGWGRRVNIEMENAEIKAVCGVRQERGFLNTVPRLQTVFQQRLSVLNPPGVCDLCARVQLVSLSQCPRLSCLNSLVINNNSQEKSGQRNTFVLTDSAFQPVPPPQTSHLSASL